MAPRERSEWLVPTRGAKTLPALEILTGRGFITGKSGSGKSNTASVIAEELLENNYNLLIVDPEGEYYGLKEQYELLHVGNDDICDAEISPNQAEKIAEITLERNMPVILDVSGYLDGDEAQELIANTVKHLYQKEKDARKPFLLMVEEMQEYLPQTGGNTELAEILERVAKRGRKRGLGLLGMSQRPSSVDKDFITQCDWMVWHRLTWKNDLDVVRNIMGSEKADAVEELDTGEGYLMTDWDESIERVQFKKKRTHDAGATPGLESYERPDLKSVSQDLVAEFQNPDAEQTELDATSEDESSQNAGEDVSLDQLESAISDPDFETPEASSVDPDTTQEATPTDVDAEIDEEVQEYIAELERENQILKDEVTELRSILSSVEEGDGSLPAVKESQSKEIELPPRPTPPRRPPDRNGLGGNLIEFMEMTVFVYKAIKYRFQIAGYQLRYRDQIDSNKDVQ